MLPLPGRPSPCYPPGSPGYGLGATHPSGSYAPPVMPPNPSHHHPHPSNLTHTHLATQQQQHQQHQPHQQHQQQQPQPSMSGQQHPHGHPHAPPPHHFHPSAYLHSHSQTCVGHPGHSLPPGPLSSATAPQHIHQQHQQQSHQQHTHSSVSASGLTGQGSGYSSLQTSVPPSTSHQRQQQSQSIQQQQQQQHQTNGPLGPSPVSQASVVQSQHPNFSTVHSIDPSMDGRVNKQN
ncbi:unnamed protein product [Protopolystoma xenopodis]|uniref:Uncharacterized protein n=1 Tax=Protopolystoma xenopodis TaxID=117903 RepID=A0A448WSH8_9PLAT|nr:unnamed protein product [Protopolystoma xenopodis]